ncbi:unnamed protein product, partial [Sphagnum compactum]
NHMIHCWHHCGRNTAPLQQLVLHLPCYIKIGTEALTKVYKMSLHLSDVSLKQIQET